MRNKNVEMCKWKEKMNPKKKEQRKKKNKIMVKKFS